jgi:hypothetical protein
MLSLRKTVSYLRRARGAAYRRARGAANIASSASEQGKYPDFCNLAAIDSSVFRSFRSNPSYTGILEHVNRRQGLDYYSKVQLLGMDTLRAAAQNDEIGGPKKISIDGIEISPTTLRYLKVAHDLEQLFGKLDGMRVCEIGVGYGGQCRLTDLRNQLESYTLVDIRPALRLADRYLSNFPIRTEVRFRTMNDLPRSEKYDLCISNYAFTELRREIQETYWSKVIAHSARGYMTYNDICEATFNSMTRDEIVQRSGGRVLPEEPLTAPKNCLIVWG